MDTQGDAFYAIAVVAAANTPREFTITPRLFVCMFNCSGGAVEVRRVSRGEFELRFRESVADALGGVISPRARSLSAQPIPVAAGPGRRPSVAFRVSAGDGGAAPPLFVVIVV